MVAAVVHPAQRAAPKGIPSTVEPVSSRRPVRLAVPADKPERLTPVLRNSAEVAGAAEQRVVVVPVARASMAAGVAQAEPDSPLVTLRLLAGLAVNPTHRPPGRRSTAAEARAAPLTATPGRQERMPHLTCNRAEAAEVAARRTREPAELGLMAARRLAVEVVAVEGPRSAAPAARGLAGKCW